VKHECVIVSVNVSILSGARVLHPDEVAAFARGGDAQCTNAIFTGAQVIRQERRDRKMVEVNLVTYEGAQEQRTFECRTGKVLELSEFATAEEFFNCYGELLK